MAHDDRDRNFEKALARHLRSSASTGVDANAAGAAAAESCPDPETLASYHDGSLSPDELNLWKHHVVGCERCQLVLAHLATPLEISVNLETSENVPAIIEPSLPSKVLSLDSRPITGPKRPPSARWLWLVPSGAIAAGLLAWVSLQESIRAPLAPPPSVEVAENRPPASTAPSAKSVPGDSIASKESAEKDQPAYPSAGATAGAASADRDSGANELHKQEQLTRQAPFEYPAKTAPRTSIDAQKQIQQAARIAGGAAGAFDQKKLDAQAAPKLEERARKYATTPPPPPPPALVQSNGQPSFIADGAAASLADKVAPAPAPAPPAASGASKAKAPSVDAISASTQTVEVTAEPPALGGARAMMRAAALQDPHVFAAPGGKQLWRLGPAGLLEHSTNSGEKWMLQTTGVNTDLLAGSAPSAKVSWIVGSSGTILRTTDGGAHWTKLDSPVTNDLIGVRATDATHAWIWFVPDQATGLAKTYQTTDGGVTWSPLPSK
ncbi:MAG: hypothetical protein WBR10_02215 [Candidatus Acidiferrum sp.]